MSEKIIQDLELKMCERIATAIKNFFMLCEVAGIDRRNAYSAVIFALLQVIAGLLANTSLPKEKAIEIFASLFEHHKEELDSAHKA